MSDTLYASIDLGGTKVACAFGTAEGDVVAERTVADGVAQWAACRPRPDARGIVNEMAAEVGGIARRSRHGGYRPCGCGARHNALLAQPADAVARRVRPRRAGAEDWLSCTYLLNDVRTATLGELVFGHGRDASTMAFFALGTGIGGGIVVDGKLRARAVGCRRGAGPSDHPAGRPTVRLREPQVPRDVGQRPGDHRAGRLADGVRPGATTVRPGGG